MRYYGTIQKSIKGIFAIQIPVDYEFFGSGVMLPPVIEVQLWGMQSVEFVFNDGQQALGRAFSHKQQQVSRYLKKGAELQANITTGKFGEIDIWGYLPTEERRQKYATPNPTLIKESKT